MEIKGILKHIGKQQSKVWEGKTYTTQKILVLVDANDKYPQTIPIEVNAKLQDQTDSWTVGNEVTVHVNMRGKEYHNKTTGEPDAFLTLSAWKVETVVKAVPQSVQNESTSDLPF